MRERKEELAHLLTLEVGKLINSSRAEADLASDMRAYPVADRLEAGMVWINHPTASRPELPFGGIKRSRYGRELGDAGITELANRKLVRYADADAPIGEVLG